MKLFARYEAAMGLFRKVGSGLGEATTLLEVGKVRALQDQYDEALARYEAAVGSYRG